MTLKDAISNLKDTLTRKDKTVSAANEIRERIKDLKERDAFNLYHVATGSGDYSPEDRAKVQEEIARLEKELSYHEDLAATIAECEESELHTKRLAEYAELLKIHGKATSDCEKQANKIRGVWNTMIAECGRMHAMNTATKELYEKLVAQEKAYFGEDALRSGKAMPPETVSTIGVAAPVREIEDRVYWLSKKDFDHARLPVE